MGVGLGSTFERLSLLYPEQHEFTVQNAQEGGTEVRIALPVHNQVASLGPAQQAKPRRRSTSPLDDPGQAGVPFEAQGCPTCLDSANVPWYIHT